MKSVIKKAIIMLLILSLTAVVLSACNKNTNKGYVVITFVTNCEIIIDPIILDGNEVNMPEDPMRAGYTFDGWFYDQLFTVAFQAGNGFSTDTTLYAKWEKKGSAAEEVKKPDDQKDSEGFSYKILDNSNYEVVGYNGFATVVTVPKYFKLGIVEKIGEGAFRNNKTLKEIKIGVDIFIISKEAFRNCSALEKITVASGNTSYTSVNGVLYNKDRSTIIAFCKNATNQSFVIGKNVLKIYEYAFSSATCDITFESNAKYTVIESFAFAEFAGRITLNNGITEIRKDSFNKASASVVFAEDSTIEEITNGAFAFYNGESLVLPNSVTNISYQPFNNCTAIVDLSRCAISSLGNQAFGSYKGQTLIVPMNVSTLDTNCFYQCTAKITFESGSLLRVVKEQAFNSFLGEVRFSSGITEIEKYAFYCASILAKITFSDKESNITIDLDAFKGSKATVIYL